MGHLPASGVGSGKLCPLLWVPVSSAARRGDNPSFIRLRQPRRKIMEPTCHSRVTTSPDISVTRCCPPAARREDSGCDGGHGGSPNTLVVRRSGRCYFWHLPKRGTPSPRVLQTYFRCKGKQFSGTGTLQHVVRAQLRSSPLSDFRSMSRRKLGPVGRLHRGSPGQARGPQGGASRQTAHRCVVTVLYEAGTFCLRPMLLPFHVQ